MSEEKGEVKIDLVADDKSADTVKKLKEGLEDVGNAAKAFLATEALIVAAIGAAVAPMLILGHAALEAADETVKQERAMTGVLGLLDKGAHSAEQVADFAHEMREELETAGLKAAVPVNQMVDSFNMLIERGGMGAQKAKDLTEQMAMVGKVTRGGMGALSQGFAMMEMGMIRGRNPIAQLIASTGVLKGNAQSVARAMMKMTSAQREALAEKALNIQSTAMEKNGLGGMKTLDEAKTFFGGFREMLFDAMGGPIHNDLMPKLNDLQNWLMDHADELKDYAKTVGEYLTKFVDFGEGTIKGVYEGIKDNWDTIEEGIGHFKEAWVEAGMTSGSIKDDFAEMTKVLVSTFEVMSQIVKGAVEMINGASDLLHGDIPGATTARNELKDVTGHADDYDDKAFNEASQKYQEMARNAGISSDEVSKQLTELHEHHREVKAGGRKMKEEVGTEDFGAFSKDLNASLQFSNDSAAVFQAKLILTSQAASTALANGGLTIAGGTEEFIKLVSKGSKETAERLKKMLDTAHGKGAIEDIKGAGPYNDFRGSQFHIKQDFKNENADNIAMVFRRDLMKAANARLQSASAPFPGL